MNGSLSLNGTWGLTYAEGEPLTPAKQFTQVSLRGRRLMDAQVPAPIHQILMDKNLIDDINVGMNSLKARWVEEQFWIYRHTFDVPEDAVTQHATLRFEKVEFQATVWINGVEVGRHANAHRPACFDVTGKLKAGENLVIVQLSTGIHDAGELPGKDYECNAMEMLTKRPWHRKPQYQCGWDWHTRLMNVGILGDVTLSWYSGPRLDHVSVFAMPSDDLSTAKVIGRAFAHNPTDAPMPATVRAMIEETGQEVKQAVTLEPGDSVHEVSIDVVKPKLWWPVGHGDPQRYLVDVTLEAKGEKQTVTRKTGVRKVEIDRSPHPDEGEYFIITINNKPIFCKGGNWVPADMLYSTVDRARYRELIDLALEANFNTLRVWGGGCFADDYFLDCCDESGVLIWHDFLFACAKYPGDRPEFMEEVRQEATWAVREMAHHPSLVVWCGNNEIEWGDWEWGYHTRGKTHTHYAIFHHDLPMITARENPSVPYWPSSPHSPDYKPSNDPTVGDQHPWGVYIHEPGGAHYWKYRTYVDRFPNEGGVCGATSPATIRQFLSDDQQYLLSQEWDHHDNPFACAAHIPGEFGRVYATLELWTGLDAEKMEWEHYAYASALIQAEALQEYITNYRSRMFSSSSAIFWMYNDSWPVTHGWTIVDYYRRKKLSFHPVRRAFEPITVVVGDRGDELVVFGVNETAETFKGDVRFGIFALAGGLPMDDTVVAEIPANSSQVLARIDKAKMKKLGFETHGAFALLSKDSNAVAQHRIFLEPFKNLKLADVDVKLEVKDGTLTATCDTFAWGVALDVDGERQLTDNCFDVIPGIGYSMPWDDSLGTPEVLRVGNRDAVVG